MKIKTYGVYGLTEWHGRVKAGTIEAKLSFVGGTSSPSGSQPAYMVTKNPITQLVIENSKEFKNGFIKLIMCQELPGTHKCIASHKEEVKSGGVETPTHKEGEGNEGSEAIEAGGEGTEGGMNGAGSEGTEGEETVTADGKAIIDVSDIDDARDYLCENFGIARSSLRSNVSVLRAADEHNIVFRGIE